MKRLVAVLLALVALLGVSTAAGDTRLYGKLYLLAGYAKLGSLSQAGTVVLSDGSNNTLTLGTQAQAANYTLSFPTAIGTAAYLLGNSATAGLLTWIDPATIGGVNYWQRTGTILSPATAQDSVQVWTDQAFGVHGRTSASGTTEAGVKGEGTAATGVCYGVAGEIASSDNAAYGGKFTRTDLGDWGDIDEQGSNPANPPTGKARYFAKAGPVAGSRVYEIMDTGVVHDLGIQARYCWSAGQGASTGSGCGLHWTRGVFSYSGKITLPATTTVSTLNEWLDDDGTAFPPDTIGNPIVLDKGYYRTSWTSVAGATPVPITQIFVSMASPCVLPAGDGGTTPCHTASAVARVRVNDTSLIDSIVISINDSASPPNVWSASVSPGGTAFYNCGMGPMNISGATGPLRVVVTCYGSLVNYGDISFDVEYLALELWAE